MAHATAYVRDGMLTVRDDGLEQALPVGSTAWARWLERPDAGTFRFDDRAMPFTARREQQRGHGY